MGNKLMDIISKNEQLEADEQCQTMADSEQLKEDQETLNNAPLHTEKQSHKKKSTVKRKKTSMTIDPDAKSYLQNFIKFEQSHEFIVLGSRNIILGKHEDDNGQIQYTYGSTRSAKEEWRDRPTLLKKVGSTGISTFSKNTVDLFLDGNHGKNVVNGYQIKSAKRWQGIVFKPGQKTDVGYNLYLPSTVKQIKGDLSPFMDFMHKVMSVDDIKIVMDFFAHLHQKPAEKPKWALVFAGAKGTGKNTIEQMLGKELLAPGSYYSTADKKKFFSQFNAHMETNLLSVMNELVWGGNHTYDSELKDLITAEDRAVERKGYDQVMVSNYSRIVMTSNSDWVVPASGKSERRYAVIDFPKDNDTVMKDLLPTKYWTDLWMWFNTGGREALMHEMMTRDLKDFTAGRAPETVGLRHQLEMSLTGVDRFVFKALEAGYFGEQSDSSELSPDEYNRINASKLFNLYILHNPKDKISQTKFGRKIGELLPVKKGRSGHAYYEFPDLNKCKTHFLSATKVQVDTVALGWNDEPIINYSKEVYDE